MFRWGLLALVALAACDEAATKKLSGGGPDEPVDQAMLVDAALPIEVAPVDAATAPDLSRRLAAAYRFMRDAGASCNADAGTPTRSAYALAAQLEKSRKNALLLCPEVAFDQASGATGNLGTTNGFRALLTEVLADMAPVLGPLTVDDVGQV